jgi:hypothetical protein
VGDAIVGIVANPLSGRDIRRLVTRASVFPTAEKANMIQRMLAALGAVGVHRALLSTDLGGISAAVLRASRRPGGRWPEVEFLDGQPIRQTAQDTVDAVRRMVTAGARVVICLGGDGTARVAASALGDVPLLALSTGTNNVFPAVREATVAGLAAGLVAAGLVPAGRACTPIAPGLVVPVGVAAIRRLDPGDVHEIDARAGVIAVDGERELTFEPGERAAVRLLGDGPRCVDVPAVLAASARLGLLTKIAAENWRRT